MASESVSIRGKRGSNWPCEQRCNCWLSWRGRLTPVTRTLLQYQLRSMTRNWEMQRQRTEHPKSGSTPGALIVSFWLPPLLSPCHLFPTLSSKQCGRCPTLTLNLRLPLGHFCLISPIAPRANQLLWVRWWLLVASSGSYLPQLIILAYTTSASNPQWHPLHIHTPFISLHHFAALMHKCDRFALTFTELCIIWERRKQKWLIKELLKSHTTLINHIYSKTNWRDCKILENVLKTFDRKIKSITPYITW